MKRRNHRAFSTKGKDAVGQDRLVVAKEAQDLWSGTRYTGEYSPGNERAVSARQIGLRTKVTELERRSLCSVPTSWWGFPSPGAAPMSEVTRILSAIEQGDPHAVDQLLPLVYDELRRLAAQKMVHECRADASGDGPRPRSVPATGGRREVAVLEWPRPFLRGGRRGYAADPGRECALQARRQTRRGLPAGCPR